MLEWQQKFIDYQKKSAGRNLKRVLSYNPKSVLDIGCGEGYLVSFLREKGIDAFGMDFSDSAGSLIKEWFIKQDARERFPFKDKEMDLVVSMDFFEHLREEDIDKVYSEMKRVGKKVIAIICFKKGEGHISIHKKNWWQNKLPKVEIIN